MEKEGKVSPRPGPTSRATLALSTVMADTGTATLLAPVTTTPEKGTLSTAGE